ncbi:MAG: DNA polymerase III subunit epsilon [Aestuariivita sp.]|nr:DNA polymerase III subunit epsilon [Aestuariivita sp.]MCY4202573.1 DNA polymerase III subunit epsilon [Aestuariivita sp.]MCY4289267.1 DNA polymerase III subunit epsilon [Aestuariivita sp.]MCY4347364.1 DNA polymerase III subunit epsilon [Aestuariivita sp.]
MREVVVDTETTGMDPDAGDRIVEIGAVELKNHLPTGEYYHQYVNPERTMPEEAFKVHGLDDNFLRDHPTFKEIGETFKQFVGEAKLVIHNAPFDMKFINAELRWMNVTSLPMDQVIDTLEIAKKRYPGAPRSLDALCRRFGVDNSQRNHHGALLDAELLASVYLELVGGKQPRLFQEQNEDRKVEERARTVQLRQRERPLAPRLTAEESKAHRNFVKQLGEQALWSSGQSLAETEI